MRKRLYVVTGLLAVDLVVTAGHTTPSSRAPIPKAISDR